MPKQRQFGTIPNNPVGTRFKDRAELSAAGVHRPTQAGISGGKTEGADSIVLNRGYIDDEDYGDYIVYTGHGGQNTSGIQIAAQKLTDSGNWALKLSFEQELPVRVIRGPKGDPKWSPPEGYRYDGLYKVVRHPWPQRGPHGHIVWRYRLERIDQSASIEPADVIESAKGPVERRHGTTDRQIRDSGKAQKLKEEYDFTCQICCTRLDSPSGPIAEAAHIKPLGRPVDGPDTKNNMLCLCPNCHKLIDRFGLLIDDSYRVFKQPDGEDLGKLTLNDRHRVSQEYLGWHRERCALAQANG